MTKLIVLCQTATAAVSMAGGRRLMLTGFSPTPVVFGRANDNDAPPTSARRFWALP